MKKIKYCPKCKSIKVKIMITPSAAFGAPQKWECIDCGFESYAVFPDEDLENNKKNERPRPKGRGIK